MTLPPGVRVLNALGRAARVPLVRLDAPRLLPGFQPIHPMGASPPQECVARTAQDFASMMFHTTCRVPGYQAWLDGADLRRFLAAHQRERHGMHRDALAAERRRFAFYQERFAVPSEAELKEVPP